MNFRLALFLAFIILHGGALYGQESRESGSVVHLSLNLLDSAFCGYTNLEDEQAMAMTLGSGLSIDFNPLPRYFFRIDGMFNYNLDSDGSMSGLEIGVGAGYAFKKDYQENAPYTNVFTKDTEIGGGWIERETTVQTGTCRAIKAQLIEAGLIKLFMQRHDYEYFYYGNEESKQEDIGDFILYAGYRMASYYKQSISTQAIIFFAHALVGLKDRNIESEIYEDNYSSHYFTNTTDTDLTLGLETGLDAYLFYFRLRYYASDLALHIGLRIPLSFVSP